MSEKELTVEQLLNFLSRKCAKCFDDDKDGGQRAQPQVWPDKKAGE